MSAWDRPLPTLSDQHLNALRWFEDHTGQDVSWPQPLEDGTFLVNRAKGIHKPAGWRYALSIRQSLNGPYPDREPETRADGTWMYRYVQESPNPTHRSGPFTNESPLACQADGIPVGVLVQVKPRPNPKYLVRGLAYITGYNNGTFQLEGGRRLLSRTPQPPDEPAGTTEFDPQNLEDARRWVDASIVRRQGQGAFRQAVLEAYDRRCAVTGCDAVEAIEAAHIVPYLGTSTNVVTNGLALRSDVHTLFDLGLITISPDSRLVEVSPRLIQTDYARYHRATLRPPNHTSLAPAEASLRRHYEWATSKWSAS